MSCIDERQIIYVFFIVGGASAYYCCCIVYVCHLLFLAYIQSFVERKQDDPDPLIKVTKSNQCAWTQRYQFLVDYDSKQVGL